MRGELKEFRNYEIGRATAPLAAAEPGKIDITVTRFACFLYIYINYGFLCFAHVL